MYKYSWWFSFFYRYVTCPTDHHYVHVFELRDELWVPAVQGPNLMLICTFLFQTLLLSGTFFFISPFLGISLCSCLGELMLCINGDQIWITYNTLYILSLVFMFQEKGFFMWMWGLECISIIIVIQILTPFMQSVYASLDTKETVGYGKPDLFRVSFHNCLSCVHNCAHLPYVTLPKTNFFLFLQKPSSTWWYCSGRITSQITMERQINFYQEQRWR